jgi:hypothetical protein
MAYGIGNLGASGLIQSHQYGYATMSGTTLSIVLEDVDLDYTILIMDSYNADEDNNTTNEICVMGSLTSSTGLYFERQKSGGNLSVTYQVVEFKKQFVKSLQTGTTLETDVVTLTTDIDEVDVEKAIVYSNGLMVTTETTHTANNMNTRFYPMLYSSSKIRIKAYDLDASNDRKFAWQVLEFR